MRRILFIGALLVGSTGIAQVYFVTDGTGATITSSAGAYIKSDNLVYSGAGTLTLANDAVISGNFTAQGTKVALGSGTVNVTGNVTSSGTIEIGSGTLDCDGTFDATGGNVTFTGSGVLEVAGNLASLGTFDRGSASPAPIIRYNGGAQNVLGLNSSSASSYPSLEIAGTGNKTLQGSSNIYGDLILTSGRLNLNGNTIYPKNNITTAGGDIIATSASTITYDNSGAHDICGVNSPNITVKTTSTAGSVTTTGNLTCGSIDMISGSKTFTVDGETVDIETDLVLTAGTFNLTSGSVNVNSNTANSCLIEGGTLDLDNGTLTIGDASGADISMTSGAIDVSGGTLNVLDELDVEDGTITQSGGTINIKSYVGSANGTSANKFDMAAGTLNLTGGTLNLNGQVANTSYTAMTVASGVTVNSTVNHTTVITTNNTTSNDEDMYIDLNGKSLGNVTVSLNGHKVVLKSDVVVLNEFILNSDGTIDLTSNTLDVKGNFTNDGTLTEGTGTVSLSGTSAQTVIGSDLGFYNLTVNNSNGVSLSNDASVSNTLTMTTGKTSLGSSHLTLGTVASISGTPSSSNMIVASGTGEVRKEFSGIGTFTFPIGTIAGGDQYSPVTLTFTGGTFGAGAYVGAKVNDAKNAIMSPGIDSYIDRTWTVEPTNISGYTYDIRLDFDAADVVENSFPVGSFFPVKYSGGEWYQPDGDATFTNATPQGQHNPLGPASGYLQWDNLTTFSEFGGAGGAGQPLPVELSAFTASCQDNGVLLHWITESEQNSSHFDVEKSSNGSDWNVISTLEAAGNSTESIHYTHLDLDKSMLEAYYRLNQVDVDGTNKFYGPIHTTCENEDITAYSFPNPSKEGFQLILQNPTMQGEAQLTITDLNGKPVLEKIISIEGGINLYQYNTSNWSPGLYNVHVKSRNSEVYLKQAVE